MPSMDDSQTGGSFLRFAFINMLLDIVYRSKDPRVILDGLRVVCQDPDLNENSDQIKVIKAIQPHSTVKYKVRICIIIFLLVGLSVCMFVCPFLFVPPVCPFVCLFVPFLFLPYVRQSLFVHPLPSL